MSLVVRKGIHSGCEVVKAKLGGRAMYRGVIAGSVVVFLVAGLGTGQIQSDERHTPAFRQWFNVSGLTPPLPGASSTQQQQMDLEESCESYSSPTYNTLNVCESVNFLSSSGLIWSTGSDYADSLQISSDEESTPHSSVSLAAGEGNGAFTQEMAGNGNQESSLSTNADFIVDVTPPGIIGIGRDPVYGYSGISLEATEEIAGDPDAELGLYPASSSQPASDLTVYDAANHPAAYARITPGHGTAKVEVSNKTFAGLRVLTDGSVLFVLGRPPSS